MQPTCNAGYVRKDGNCVQACPSDYKDEGDYCTQPEMHYSRSLNMSVPTAYCSIDHPYVKGAGLLSWCSKTNNVMDFNTKPALFKCPPDKEMISGMCYPVCKNGYIKGSNGLETMCYKQCPAEMKYLNGKCKKNSYNLYPN